MVGDWVLTVTGEIVRVDRENIDKSGRNPKFALTFIVRPTEGEGVPAGATLPAELPIRIHDRDLAKLIAREPVVGDRVVMSGKANGPRPATFYMTAVRPLSGAG